VNRAVVHVRDERVGQLTDLYKPRKTVYASVEFMDLEGMSRGSNGSEPFSAQSMAAIRQADALALVIRNFPEDPSEPPSPLADLANLEQELLLSDMLLCEGRIERIQWGRQRGKKTDALTAEESLLKKLLDQVNASGPIRDLDLSETERKMIRGFQFLTEKPLMVILNSDEATYGHNGDLVRETEKAHRTVEFVGKFEMELALLDGDEEAELFMQDMGIQESAADRLTRMAYDMLAYISFFTVGEDEVRAWNLVRGDTALDAAAAIHTDLARGFIRAECFSYADTVAFGSEKKIRESGRFRLEGKNYVVQDGDILSIRFNV
jgi:GTP-binding protein YchF